MRPAAIRCRRLLCSESLLLGDWSLPITPSTRTPIPMSVDSPQTLRLIAVKTALTL